MIIKNICQIVVLSGGLIVQVFAQQQSQINEIDQPYIGHVPLASESQPNIGSQTSEAQSKVTHDTSGIVDPYLKMRTAVPVEPINEDLQQNLNVSMHDPSSQPPVHAAVTDGKKESPKTVESSNPEVNATLNGTFTTDQNSVEQVAVAQSVSAQPIQKTDTAQKASTESTAPLSSTVASTTAASATATSIPSMSSIPNQPNQATAVNVTQENLILSNVPEPVDQQQDAQAKLFDKPSADRNVSTHISTVEAQEKTAQFEKHTTMQTSSMSEDEPHASIHMTITRPVIERDLILAVNLESQLAANQAVVLKDLSFKTVMMSFYQKNMKAITIPELDAENRQYVGFSQYDPEINAVLVFDQAETFQNAANEPRYLLTVSKLKIQPESNKIEYCPTCSAFTDVYIFKKTENDQFQLINYSPVGEGWWSQGIKAPQYSAPALKKSLVSIGPKQKGILTKQEVSTYSEGYRALDVTPIYENKPLNQIRVAKLEASNRGSVYHKIFSTKANYKLLNSVNDGLYDIEIHLTGTRLIEQKSDFNLVPVNEKQIYQFNAKKQRYIRFK